MIEDNQEKDIAAGLEVSARKEAEKETKDMIEETIGQETVAKNNIMTKV